MSPKRRDAAGSAPSGGADSPDRVALLLADADADLVAAELDDDYRVRRGDDALDEPFDVAVVDERAAAHRAALADRVEASATFLPVLCLLPRNATVPPSVWAWADDAATRPLRRRELRARVDALLRTRRLSARLHRRNERLERVGAVVAHDLRNPLAVAAGYVDRAVETGDVDDLAPAVDALDRADRLVDDVLSLARHGSESLDTTTCSLDDVVRATWAGVDTAGATLEVADDLGTIAADESRLRELLENLFRNAVEHGSTGDRSPGRSGAAVAHAHAGDQTPRESDDAVDHAPAAAVHVTVERLPDGGFAVADDGTGIPADAREDVFEYGHTTRTGGTGLGLAIASEIAALHGWHISAEESADGGARFEVVPRADGPRASP